MKNRQLKAWLTDYENAQIAFMWREQLERREELKDKPSELTRYQDKLT